MIPVTPQPEPQHFDKRVRQRGLDAIRELVGEQRLTRRRGRKLKKVADRREEVPPDAFPEYWHDSLDDMSTAYGQICAYLGIYIHHATGNATIDHVLPKSRRWDMVYEWSNYRMACGLINSKKNNLDLVLDPFRIEDGLFALELTEYQVIPGDAAGRNRQRVLDTRDVLGLNGSECCKAREAYVEEYNKGHLSLDYLERHAPFIARELRRQNRLKEGD